MRPVHSSLITNLRTGRETVNLFCFDGVERLAGCPKAPQHQITSHRRHHLVDSRARRGAGQRQPERVHELAEANPLPIGDRA